jgi:hypothetical protein
MILDPEKFAFLSLIESNWQVKREELNTIAFATSFYSFERERASQSRFDDLWSIRIR